MSDFGQIIIKLPLGDYYDLKEIVDQKERVRREGDGTERVTFQSVGLELLLNYIKENKGG